MPRKGPKSAEQKVPLMTSETNCNPETIHHRANKMGSDLNTGENTLLTKTVEDNEAPSSVEAHIKAGADVDYSNSLGKAALMLAVKVRGPARLKVLIEYGADPKLKTLKCISAISLCLTGELYSYLEILLRQSMSSVDAMCNNLEEICSFLQRCNINKHNDKNKSDYWCSISNTNPRLISIIKRVYYIVFNYMNGTTPLRYAVRSHSEDCLRLLLLAGADVNMINKSQETSLALAMTRSHNRILRDLIRAGALQRHPWGKISTFNFGIFKLILDYLQQTELCNIQYIYGKTSLMYAAKRGQKACLMYSVEMDIEKFLKQIIILDSKENYVQVVGGVFDADPVAFQCAVKDIKRRCKNRYQKLLEDSRRGDSTVIYAIRYFEFLNEDITKLLVGDTHKEQYQDGKTALMIAVSGYNGGSHTYLEPFIGDSYSIQDKDGKTALMYALINNMVSHDLLKQMIGDSQNVQDNDGKTALMYALNNKLVPDDLLEQLIGDSQNLKDRDGKTSLMYALINKERISENILQMMIGDSQNIQDNDGKTALMYAFINKERISENILQMMIGDSQNIQDHDGKTALMYAFIHKKQPPKKLICHLCGKTPFIQDNSGKTALMYAFKSNHYMNNSLILKLLGDKVDIRDNDGNTLLIYVFKFYTHIKEEIGNLLVGDTQNDRYQHGKTSLMVALEHCNNWYCIHFVKLHFDCLCDVQDNSGRTILMYAMRHNSPLPEHIFDQMIRQSQIIQDNDGKTALMHFSLGPNVSSTNFFTIKLFHKDALNIQDNEGKTALHHAIEHHQLNEFIELLILQGSNLEVEDKQKRTALDLCLEFDTREDVFLCEWVDAFIKTKMLLKYNPMPILGLLGKMSLLTCIQRGWFSLNNLWRDKDIFRLMIINDIEPFPHLRENMSTFFSVLKENLIDVAKYLIANMYVTNEDLMLLIKAKNYLKSHEFLMENQLLFNGTFLDLSSPDLQHLVTEATSQPWPLVKLSFVVVSSAVGHGTNREDRVNRLPLPNPIKESLMFNTRTALIPVSEWSKIPMIFDPVEYEKTRRPMPLLKYWPFGAEL